MKAIPTNCLSPGCPIKVMNGSYCIEHKNKTRAFDKRKDNKAEIEQNRFRNTRAWRKLSGWILRQEPLCRSCGKASQQVDHIIPLSKGGAPLDSANLQALCASCHSIKTRVENS